MLQDFSSSIQCEVAYYQEKVKLQGIYGRIYISDKKYE